MHPSLKTMIDSIQVGTPKIIKDDIKSAIFKTPIVGPVQAGPMGLEGDTQVDREHHGGTDKAIHFYSSDHYSYWQTEFPDASRLFTSGYFGENLVAAGLQEEDVCLGDQFRLGSALLAVSQGRQPCWKLAAKTGVNRLPLMIERTGKTGFYCRVIETGLIEAGQTMTLVARPLPEWPLTRLWETLFRKGAKQEDLKTLLNTPELSDAWKARAEKKQRLLSPC